MGRATYCLKDGKYLVALMAFALLMLSINNANANNWWDPMSRFDASKLMTEKSTIKWVRVKDIQATCEAESRKRGLGGFGYSVDACSFWDKNLFGSYDCQIFSKIKPTLNDLGHEVRHCFQGNFH